MSVSNVEASFSVANDQWPTLLTNRSVVYGRNADHAKKVATRWLVISLIVIPIAIPILLHYIPMQIAISTIVVCSSVAIYNLVRNCNRSSKYKLRQDEVDEVRNLYGENFVKWMVEKTNEPTTLTGKQMILSLRAYKSHLGYQASNTRENKELYDLDMAQFRQSIPVARVS